MITFSRLFRGLWLRKSIRFSAAVTLIAWLLSAQSANAQDWAKAMFDKTTYDFGSVARGAKVEHRFVIENIYEEDVHIRSVSSNCGCSTPEVSQKLLKTWEKAEILVTMDTRKFLGRKDATIEVKFDQPFFAGVQLHIHAYIRSDIVVQPGAVQFGSVVQGAGANQSVIVSYAGRDDWKIARVECANPHIEASVAETNRTPGQINYNLAVRLKPDAPAGYIRDQLVLVTNDFDARAARVPIAVEGLVVSTLSVRPSPLMMGVAEAGQPIVRNLVVQGQTPFRIVSVTCSDRRFECQLPREAKTTHILPVRFLADASNPSGDKVSVKIRIETDLTGVNSKEVDVSVQIMPSAVTPP